MNTCDRKRWKQLHREGTEQVWGPGASSAYPTGNSGALTTLRVVQKRPVFHSPSQSNHWIWAPRRDVLRWGHSLQLRQTRRNSLLFPQPLLTSLFRDRGEGSLRFLELVLEFLSLLQRCALIKTLVSL